MPTRKSTAKSSPPASTSPAYKPDIEPVPPAEPTPEVEAILDGGKGDRPVTSSLEEAAELGYWGSKVDPLPNSAHSQESGPNAPSPLEQRRALEAVEAAK